MTEINENSIAIFTAVGASLIALGYKFLRIIKSDRTHEQVDAEETAFRLSLREEVKALREMNCLLVREKLDLLERAVKAEAENEHRKQKCLECRFRLESEKDDH